MTAVEMHLLRRVNLCKLRSDAVCAKAFQTFDKKGEDSISLARFVDCIAALQGSRNVDEASN